MSEEDRKREHKWRIEKYTILHNKWYRALQIEKSAITAIGKRICREKRKEYFNQLSAFADYVVSDLHLYVLIGKE